MFHAGYLARPKAQLENYRAGAGSAPMLYCIGNAGADLLTSKHGFRRTAVDWTSKARTASAASLSMPPRSRILLPVSRSRVASTGTSTHPLRRNSGHNRARGDARKPTPLSLVGAAPRGRQGNRALHYSRSHDRAARPAAPRWPQPQVLFLSKSTAAPCRSSGQTLAQSSLLRKLIGYGLTYRGEYHKHVYGLPNFRVLMIVPGRKRIESLIEAFRAHAASIAVSPRLFLFAERGCSPRRNSSSTNGPTPRATGTGCWIS